MKYFMHDLILGLFLVSFGLTASETLQLPKSDKKLKMINPDSSKVEALKTRLIELQLRFNAQADTVSGSQNDQLEKLVSQYEILGNNEYGKFCQQTPID